MNTNKKDYIIIGSIDWQTNWQTQHRLVSSLVENNNRARTDGFAKVSLDKEYPSGKILNMIVTGKNKFGLIGKVIA